MSGQSALDNCPALVLNAVFRPLNYFPLSLWSWQDSVKSVFLNRVNVISEYDKVIHSPSWAINLPSVISLKEYVHLTRRPAFTRFHVFLRDRFTCQYCDREFPTPLLTFDHVTPRSRGGRTQWSRDTVVTFIEFSHMPIGLSLISIGLIFIFDGGVHRFFIEISVS